MRLWRAFGSALILNVLWEFSHAGLYLHYRGGSVTAALLLLMAVKDAVIISALVTAQRSIAALRPHPWIIPVIAFILAAAVELHALSTGRWAYASAMPILPVLGLGLSALIQLPLTSFLSYRFSL